MGVRYNAEKRKVGMYYSTPIYAFRCKCHLCDGWFEIHTDPKVSTLLHVSSFLINIVVLLTQKNTRYVVKSGARQQEVDWDPEENGGFAVHGNSSETIHHRHLMLGFRYKCRTVWVR